MTEPELVWDGARIRVAEDGSVSLALDDAVYLTAWGPQALLLGDTEVGLGPARSTVLADEIQLEWRPLPGVELTVRHGFGSVWAQRVLLRVAPDAGLPDAGLPDAGAGRASEAAVLWRLVPGPDAVCWAAPAGAAGTIALLPREPGQPVLGLRLATGALNGSPDRLVTGPIGLRPEGGTVLIADLMGERYLDTARLADGLRQAVRTGWLPATQDLSAGEPLVLRHEDGALSEGGTALATDADGTWLVDAPGAGAGRRRLILDDAAGRTVLDLCWAPPTLELVRRAAAAVLAGPTSAQGSALLPDASAAAIVGWGLSGGGASGGGLDLELAERAEEALEGWLAAHHPPSVWRMLAAVQEHQRTGETAWLELADQQLDALTVPQRDGGVPPGLGLVGTQVVLALLAAGRDARSALGRLRSVAGAELDPLGRAELALVLGTRFGGGQHPMQADDLVRGAWQAVTLLGAGLRGRPAEDPGLVVRARAITLCALLPGVGDPFLHRTAQPVGTLARSAGNRLSVELSELVDVGPVGEDARSALLWLGLAAPDLES